MTTSGFTFEFLEEHLAKMIPNNQNITDWYNALYKILPDYEINTPTRVASFIAQCCHESAQFTATTENLNYSAVSLRKNFSKYFPTISHAEECAGKPEKIANRIYGNRMGNGNVESGDGFRFRGRGLIQLTGRDNYQEFANSIDVSIDGVIEYMDTFEGCVQSACWFWSTNNLNHLSDKGDLVAITKRINGGTNGLDDRKRYYASACAVFQV